MSTGGGRFDNDTTYLDMLAHKVWHLARELPRVIDGTWGHFISTKDTMREGDTVIVFTKCGSLVDDTRPALVRNVGIIEDTESFVLVLKPDTKISAMLESERDRNEPAR